MNFNLTNVPNMSNNNMSNIPNITNSNQPTNNTNSSYNPFDFY